MSAIDFYGDEPGNNKAVVFLCKSRFGRFLYNLTLFLQVPKVLGAFLRSPLSRLFIKGFIKSNKIDMTAFARRKFKSFNDFFTRVDPSRVPDIAPDYLISPCDSALSVYKIEENIEENTVFHIKGFDYSLADFFETDKLDSKYSGGDCLVFRLAATDYHRYCYIDSGSLEDNHFIKGALYSVQPVCCAAFRVYTKNRRSWTILRTENFGDVAQVEIGAFAVGGIKNHHENYRFKKGEEKGYFDLHGSTIVLLFEKGRISLDSEILEKVSEGKEVPVKYGQRIGERPRK